MISLVQPKDIDKKKKKAPAAAAAECNRFTSFHDRIVM